MAAVKQILDMHTSKYMAFIYIVIKSSNICWH